MREHWLFLGSVYLVAILLLSIGGGGWAGGRLGGQLGKEIGIDIGIGVTVVGYSGLMLHLIRLAWVQLCLALGPESVPRSVRPGVGAAWFVRSTDRDLIIQVLCGVFAILLLVFLGTQGIRLL